MTFAIPTYASRNASIKTKRKIEKREEEQQIKDKTPAALKVLISNEPTAKGILEAMFASLSNCKIISVPGARRAPKTPTGLGSSNHKGWDVSPLDKTKLQKFEVYSRGSSRYFLVNGLEFTLLEEDGFGNYGRNTQDGKKIYLGHLDVIKEVHMGSPVAYVRVGNTGHSTGTHLHFEVRYGNSSNG